MNSSATGTPSGARAVTHPPLPLGLAVLLGAFLSLLSTQTRFDLPTSPSLACRLTRIQTQNPTAATQERTPDVNGWLRRLVTGAPLPTAPAVTSTIQPRSPHPFCPIVAAPRGSNARWIATFQRGPPFAEHVS